MAPVLNKWKRPAGDPRLRSADPRVTALRAYVMQRIRDMQGVSE